MHLERLGLTHFQSRLTGRNWYRRTNAMRHRVSGRKFGLPSDQRRALLKGLVRSLFAYDKIVTTETRAKDVKPIAEKLITTAKRGDITARRQRRRYVDSNVSAFAV